MKRSRSLIVLMTVAVLLFAFAGLAVAAEADDAAERLEGFGVIEGYPDGTMGLEREITRAEFAKIAVVAKGLEEAADLLQANPSQFSDVQTNVWYTGWVNVANAQGIVKGDPVGTFRPNDNISVAEAVAMILRTLGYNDNLPGAWPTNYLVKGADLGVTTGVVTNANAKALRGDVFTMLNRAFDEDVVAWETRDKGADAADFVEKGYTLLQDMFNAKLEYKGWVVDNFRTDDSLDANEIRIAEKELDGKTEVFTLLSNDDVDWLLGLEVDVKHNTDEEIAYVEVETSDSNIIFDLVSKDDLSGNRDVELKVKDREYAYDEDAVLFVNFKDENELTTGQYGKFVLKGGKIATAVAFEADDVGIVSEIDKDIYEFVYGDVEGTDAEEGDFDFADFDEVVVFDTNLTVLDGEIEVYDVVYTFEAEVDGDDVLYVVVSSAKVEGELERLRDDSNRIIVDGSTYRKADFAVFTLNEGDDYKSWGSDVEDLLGEDVILSTDFIGYVMLAMGDSAATSGAQYGLVTWYDGAARNPVATIFTAEGKEVEYTFETRADANKLRGYDFARPSNDIVVVEYKLNKDGEIAEDEFAIANTEEKISKEVDRRYVTGDGRYYISSNTVFIHAIDDGEIDPSALKYDDIYRTSFTNENVVVYLNENNEAKAIAFIDEDFVGTGDDDFYGVVTSRPWQDSNEWYTDIDVYGEGEEEYMLDSRARFVNKSLVQFTMTSGDKAKVVSNPDLYEGEVDERDGNFLTIDGKQYRVASGAVLYTFDKDDDLETTRLSRIGEGDTIEYLLDDNQEIVAALVGVELDGDKDPVDPVDPVDPEDPVITAEVAANPSGIGVAVTVDADGYDDAAQFSFVTAQGAVSPKADLGNSINTFGVAAGDELTVTLYDEDGEEIVTETVTVE